MENRVKIFTFLSKMLYSNHMYFEAAYEIAVNVTGEEMKKNGIVIEGFSFTDKETAQKALREAESIKYVKENLDMKNPRMVLEMYRKLTTERVFETPVGLMYLRKLRDYLSRIPEIEKEELEPIQVKGPAKPAAARQQLEKVKVMAGQGETVLTEEEKLAEQYEEKLDQEKEKRRAAELRQRRSEGKLKSSRGFLHFSLAVNFFLLIVAVGMIVITLMDDHPNIINYENKIVDKYTQWEQELEEREKILKEREQGD